TRTLTLPSPTTKCGRGDNRGLCRCDGKEPRRSGLPPTQTGRLSQEMSRAAEGEAASLEFFADRVECRGLRPGTLPHHWTYGFPYPAVGLGDSAGVSRKV